MPLSWCQCSRAASPATKFTAMCKASFSRSSGHRPLSVPRADKPFRLVSLSWKCWVVVSVGMTTRALWMSSLSPRHLSAWMSLNSGFLSMPRMISRGPRIYSVKYWMNLKNWVLKRVTFTSGIYTVTYWLKSIDHWLGNKTPLARWSPSYAITSILRILAYKISKFWSSSLASYRTVGSRVLGN